MTDEEALLEAIRSHPDDDMPRLAYADWLDESGAAAEQARATFIRAQIEAAHLPEEDSRRKTLSKSADFLHSRHASAWEKPLLSCLGDNLVTYGYHRGFVSSLSGSEAAIVQVYPVVAPLFPIQRLAIETKSSEIQPDFAPLSQCPELAHLRQLALLRFSEAVARPLLSSPYLVGLRSLRLQWGWVEPAIELVARSTVGTSLRRLWAKNSGLGVITPGHGLGTLLTEEWPALEEARIDNFAVGNDGARLLAIEFATRKLRSLHVSDDSLTVPGVIAVVRAILDGGLDSVSLARFETTRALGEWEDPSDAMLGAKELRFKGFWGSGAALVEWIVGEVPPGRFDQLAVTGSKMNWPAARLLAAWPGLASVKKLDLSNNWIGDQGAVALAESPHLENVERLLVAHNDISKAGKDALKSRFGRRVRIT